TGLVDQLDRSAGCFDLLFRLRREGVRLDGEGAIDLALRQDLHAAPMTDQTAFAQQLGRDLGAGVELVERLQVDDGEVFLVGVLEARQLRQPHGQRGLTALEPGTELAAGLGALGAPAGGLAALAALTPPDPDLRLLRARGRLQVVERQFFSLVGHAVLHSRKPEVGDPAPTSTTSLPLRLEAGPGGACPARPACRGARRSGGSSAGRASRPSPASSASRR